MDIKNLYSISPPETPKVIKEAHEISRLSGRLAAPFVDFDDESIRGEIERLSVHQQDLQKELQAVMQAVNIVQFTDESEELNLKNTRSLSFRSTLSQSERNSLQQNSWPEENEISEISMTEEDTPVIVSSSIREKMTFAKAFFHFSRPKKQQLEEQKQRQKEILKEDLAKSHPGLEDILEIHHEMQNEIVEDAVAKNDLPRSNEIIEKKKISLEEEKERQMKILAEKISDIDPDLMESMHSERLEQAGLVAKKKDEMRDKGKQGRRLTQTKLTKNFWNGAMSRLGISKEDKDRPNENNADGTDAP